MKKKMTIEELHKEMGELHEEMSEEISGIKEILEDVHFLISSEYKKGQSLSG